MAVDEFKFVSFELEFGPGEASGKDVSPVPILNFSEALAPPGFSEPFGEVSFTTDADGDGNTGDFFWSIELLPGLTMAPADEGDTIL